MSGNRMNTVFTPVMQGKNQQHSKSSMMIQNTGNTTSNPVTGASYTGASFLSGNSVNAAPPEPQGPVSTFGIGGNSSF